MKKQFTMFALGLLFCLSTGVFAVPAVAQMCVPPPGGMFGWWPGDGNGNDIQGGNNGTLQGGTTFGSGEVLQAFSFPSAGSVNIRYSSIPTPAGITVDAWVKPASTVGGASIFNWRPVANNTGITLEQRFTADGEVLWNVFATGGTASVISGTTLLPLNTWTHVAGTYDGTTATLYFNGVAVANTTTASGSLTAIAGDAMIGRNIVVSGDVFNGLIDEVEIFNRALSTTEILAIVNAGSAGKCKDTIFRDGFGDTYTLTVPSIRINEIETGTIASATDEFVELFNAGGVAADIGGYKLVYRSAAGTSDVLLATVPAIAVPAGGYYLFGGSGYIGSVTADQRFVSGTGLSAMGGGIGLRNAIGTLVDSVGYGTATNAFIESAPAPAPPTTTPPGSSIGRLPNGTDSNDNSIDFKVTASPTPRAPNQ